jgi:hypothetical protein
VTRAEAMARLRVGETQIWRLRELLGAKHVPIVEGRKATRLEYDDALVEKYATGDRRELFAALASKPRPPRANITVQRKPSRRRGGIVETVENLPTKCSHGSGTPQTCSQCRGAAPTVRVSLAPRSDEITPSFARPSGRSHASGHVRSGA